MSPHADLDPEKISDMDSQSPIDMYECGSTRSSSSLSLVDTHSSISSASEMESSNVPNERGELGESHNVDIKPMAPNAPNTPFFTHSGTIYPRSHIRSRSVPTSPYRNLSKDATSMLEEINGLKSFQQIWNSKSSKIEEVSNSNACHERKRELKPASVDDSFEFPFFHLSPADFEWQEYRFPFSRLDATDFRKPRERIPFPFSHIDPERLGWAPGREKKPGSPLKKLMQMVGLDEVKKEFLSIQARIKAFQKLVEKPDRNEKSSCKKRYSGKNRKEKPSIRSLKLDLIISGSHGTGKSTIAQLYVDFLEHLGVVIDDDTAYIIDDEYYFYKTDSKEGVFVVEGDKALVKGMLNYPKANERFSKRIDIKDYSEGELLSILVKLLKEDSLKVEGGYDAPFLLTFIRQLKQRKGKKFRNVKTLQAGIEKARSRQAERQEKDTSKKDTAVVSIPNASYRLTESDFLGERPDNFYERSESWKKLEKMAGMDQVKESVKELVTRRHINYARERAGKEPLKMTFNHVFLGPPGTGKTTVATLFGQIIADLGYIEDRKVVIKKPTDFLGRYVGHSEDMTKDILDETEGKVLIIDEAHMFYHGSEHGTDKSDIFRKGIIDTIVAHVDNEPGSNRCIILMGYPDRMKEFYRNTNPGLQRRFPLDTAFVFEDYDDKSLNEIMDIMLAKDEIIATAEAKTVAMEVLRRERDRPNFGNGGSVRNLISRAQITYSKRIASHAKGDPQPEDDSLIHGTEASQIVLEPQDFDPEYDRGLRANKDFRSLFKDLVGFQDIIGTFEGYQKMTANMKQHGLEPREEIPFSFVFKGPPGTGKTTTARALGQIYHSMGFLSTTEVMDCSVTDLVSSNGLTGQKVQNLLERSLGKVLFIDEAYRMGQRDLTGAFISCLAQEAVGELVDCMTKEKFAGKLVIVLAGYEKDMDQLMSTNEGLRGRFTEMAFPNMRPKDCLRLLQKKLEHRKISILHPSGKQVLDKVIGLFEKLSKTEAWANARDMESIAKCITRQVFMKELPAQGALDISLEEIAAVLKQLYQQRKPRNGDDGS